jgi:hypothetical protein
MKMQITVSILLLFTFLITSNSQENPLIYNLVEKGVPLAKIEVMSGQPPKIFHAARILQTYIKKSTQARLPFNNEISPDLFDRYPVHIHINVRKQKSKNPFHKADGFIIDLSTLNHISIIGNSATGAEFAVYEFLERFVGIRWLLPGSLGEHIPHHKSLIIKSQTIKQAPVFSYRRLSGLHEKYPDIRKWAHRNRMYGDIKFHHNLHNIFPSDKYLKSHPHLYPQKNGKLNVPYPKAGWQPCFQEQDAIDIAVLNISNYFKEHPDENTFSLGPNDAISSTSGYCISDEEAKIINSWGYPDVSDRYYTWANQVVKKVLNVYPDKLFGTLAYMEIATPPKKIQIHQNIIPFLTEDRLRWVKSKYKFLAKKRMNDWLQKSKHIGFYDYIYGSPYVLPRVYFHHMAETYKYAAQKGVNAVYAEAYPIWGEGPKYYLALKLFWNPFLDVDNLLNDWYQCCVGKSAAPYLAQYFKLWETFWTQKIQHTPWFYNKSMYLAFWSPTYLDAADIKDITKSRELLEKTLGMAKTEIQKKKSTIILKNI